MRLLLTSLLSTLLYSSGYAQTLSLGDVLASVERSYPLLEAARQKLAKAEGEALAARGAFDVKLKGKATPQLLSKKETYGHYEVSFEQPTTHRGVSLYGGWSLGVGAFPEYYGQYVTTPRGELSLGAVLPVLRGGAIDEARAAIQQTTLERDAVNAEVTESLLWYRRAASHKYWDWVAAGALLEVEERLLRLAEERDAAVHSRVKQGLLPEIEALDNERLVISRRAKRLEATLKLQQVALELSLYLRTQDGQPLIPGVSQLPGWPSIRAPKPEELAPLIQAALARRPELTALRARRAQADVSLYLAQNQLLPSLDLTLEATQALGGGAELGAGLRFELPLQQRRPSKASMRQSSRTTKTSSAQRCRAPSLQSRSPQSWSRCNRPTRTQPRASQRQSTSASSWAAAPSSW